MGKRSNFERVPRDYYPTPEAAIQPLLAAESTFAFVEPCAGDFRLARVLIDHGHFCRDAFDIEPRSDRVRRADALTEPLLKSAVIVTNPPWNRKFLHPFIERCIKHGDAWLLFDADWMHTKQSASYMEYCSEILSVGRVKWIPDSKMTGKENCCWYHFTGKTRRTFFIGR